MAARTTARPAPRVAERLEGVHILHLRRAVVHVQLAVGGEDPVERDGEVAGAGSLGRDRTEVGQHLRVSQRHAVDREVRGDQSGAQRLRAHLANGQRRRIRRLGPQRHVGEPIDDIAELVEPGGEPCTGVDVLDDHLSMAEVRLHAVGLGRELPRRRLAERQLHRRKLLS
jgi:hypothetical protein